ncbi:MAG: membrane-bound lytic murein transglycosylase A [Paraglaciecola sp.]|jgi:membrane-bound lytic murein transglycosylase A
MDKIPEPDTYTLLNKLIMNSKNPNNNSLFTTVKSYILLLFTILDYFLQAKDERIKTKIKVSPMNISKLTLLAAVLITVSIGCQDSATSSSEIGVEANIPNAAVGKLVKTTHQRYRNGKIKNAEKMPSIFTESSFDTLSFPTIDEKMIQALTNQLDALKKRKTKKNQRIAGLDVSIEKLEETIQLLINHADNPALLKSLLTAHQTWGKDKKGNVKFTGYFTPIVRVKKQKDSLYQYPFYASPENWEGSLPTRKQIDSEGVLKGRGLEIAYASNPVDVYYMQLQGSGFIKFVETGEKILLRYDGSNRKRYRSIETYLARRDDLKIRNLSNTGVKNFLLKNLDIRQDVLNHNPSYAFFRPSKSSVKGAGGVPLMASVSIAADPKYFPIGSVALASIPIYNKKGKIDYHEYRLLLAQDVGGAIRGAGHVDIYSGVGPKGKTLASQRHHYGQLWLLLPQENHQLALNSL